MIQLLENTDYILEIKSVPIDKSVKAFEKTNHNKKIKQVIYYEPHIRDNGIVTYIKVVLSEYLLDKIFEKQKQLEKEISFEEVELDLPY